MTKGQDYLTPGIDNQLDQCKCPEMRWLLDVGKPQFERGLQKARLALQPDCPDRRGCMEGAAADLADAYLRDEKSARFESEQDFSTLSDLIEGLEGSPDFEFQRMVVYAMALFFAKQTPDVIAILGDLMDFQGRVEPWKMARLYELRAGLNLTTGDQLQVRRDLDRAIAIQDNPGRRFQRAMITRGLGDARASFEDLAVYMERAHPDGRQYAVNAYSLTRLVMNVAFGSAATDEVAGECQPFLQATPFSRSR
jgi:hypothetical protein